MYNIYICIHVYMYVCMCVYIYIYIYVGCDAAQQATATRILSSIYDALQV